MNRVLLTGASGFIGRHCVPELQAAGYEVHAVCRSTRTGEASGVIWHQADLLDPVQTVDLVERVGASHLLHLAWYVEPSDFWSSPENVAWLRAGLDLAIAFAEAGGERAVMAGTCAEYAPSSAALVEGVTPLRPQTLYGACKAALHLAAARYFADRDVSFAWGHIFHLFGPGEDPGRLVPSAIRALARGETFTCENPEDVRDYLGVEDVARAFVMLLGSGVRGDVNIASGEPMTIGSLAGLVAASLGREDLLVCDPGSESSTAVVGDATRLMSEVGWRPGRTTAERIEGTIAWWARRSDWEGGADEVSSL